MKYPEFITDKKPKTLKKLPYTKPIVKTFTAAAAFASYPDAFEPRKNNNRYRKSKRSPQD